jgi:hypothetical protein
MVEEAIAQVKGFKELYQEFEDKILISGNSSSALNNYGRKVAEVCLHFDRLPQGISEKDLNRYLISDKLFLHFNEIMPGSLVIK